MTHDGRQMKVEVTSDGAGLISHAGSALLAQVADKTGLTRALSRELGPLQLREGSHDRGRVVRDLAVMLADGGDCLADMAARASRTTSATTKTPACAICRFATSSTTASGLRSCASRTT